MPEGQDMMLSGSALHGLHNNKKQVSFVSSFTMLLGTHGLAHN